MLGKRPDTPSPRLLRVDRSARPGWKTGKEQPPDPGQLVYCTEGMAEVVRVVGKTGDGSRLLELRLLEKEAPPFYAAASNVLVMPAEGAGDGQAANAGLGAPATLEFAGNGNAAGAAAATLEPAPGVGVDAHGAAGGSPDEEAEVGSGAASHSFFLDTSWALAGSLVPGGEALPGSLVIPEQSPAGDGAESGASEAGPVTPEPVSSSAGISASEDADLPAETAAQAEDAAGADVVAAPDDAEDDDPARYLIIGVRHGPAPGPDGGDGMPADPGKQPPTIPLDPRVHWIG